MSRSHVREGRCENMGTFARVVLAAAVSMTLWACPTCPTGQTMCDGVCKDLNVDSESCGACGNACPNGASCQGGTCACPSAMPMRCGSQCVDPQSDPFHCGACGKACGLGTCNAGACTCATTPATVTRCPGASPECVDLASDPRHCNGCGMACSGGKECAMSACRCPAAKPMECMGTCANTMTDVANCGACGTVCTRANGVCAAGMCACPSSKPTYCMVGDTCADTATDRAHCGGCGMPCTRDGGTCTAGTCVCPTSAPDFCAGTNVCTDVRKDSANCGTCGFRCGMSAACAAGTCCGDGGVVCSGSCCPGAECCTGDTCPTRHSNGLGGQFYDCNALGTHGPASQRAAAEAWKPGTDLSGFPCANTLCLKREAADQCALFCDNGAVTRSTVGSIVCLCAEQGAAFVSTWN